MGSPFFIIQPDVPRVTGDLALVEICIYIKGGRDGKAIWHCYKFYLKKNKMSKFYYLIDLFYDPIGFIKNDKFIQYPSGELAQIV